MTETLLGELRAEIRNAREENDSLRADLQKLKSVVYGSGARDDEGVIPRLKVLESDKTERDGRVSTFVALVKWLLAFVAGIGAALLQTLFKAPDRAGG